MLKFLSGFLDREKHADEQAVVLDTSQMEVGDVVTSTQDSWVSLGIRRITRSGASHAAIYIGGGFLIEAVGEAGVRRVHARSFIYPSASYVEVHRPRDVQLKQRQAAAARAVDLLRRPYSVGGAVGSVSASIRMADDPGKFCSQVVEDAFTFVNHPLTTDVPEGATPESLRSSPKLELRPHAKRTVTKRFVDWALQELKPSFFEEASPNAPTAEQRETQVTDHVTNTVEESPMFKRPIHLPDVLRQLADAYERDREFAEHFHNMVLARMPNLMETGSRPALIEPRHVIPGLVMGSPGPYTIHLPTAPDEPTADELRRLMAEVETSRAHDESFWDAQSGEWAALYAKTGYAAFKMMELWVGLDGVRSKRTYHALFG